VDGGEKIVVPVMEVEFALPGDRKVALPILETCRWLDELLADARAKGESHYAMLDRFIAHVEETAGVKLTLSEADFCRDQTFIVHRKKKAERLNALSESANSRPSTNSPSSQDAED
jgi:hypothetical protein